MSMKRDSIKRITILGSTGSIGTQTLQVVEESSNRFEIEYLTTNKNIELLAKQVLKFHPKGIVIKDYEKYKEFRKHYSFSGEILTGEEGLCKAASNENNDMVVSALVGFSGVLPTICALEKGIDVALANKEVLVSAGKFVSEISAQNGASIVAIDSEHNAILQCLIGEDIASVEKIILTASGGPFFGSSIEALQDVGVEEALAHPRWNMGRKISVDSATLMNKGFEVIEAHWLFNLSPAQIQVVVHPESIIHSLVQFVDGSIKAHLGYQDMRIPISFALNYPKRNYYNFPRIDLIEIGKLSFSKPDTKTFPCLKYAYEALEIGGTAPAILNSANETAVQAFLEKRITFVQIPACIDFALNNIDILEEPSLEDVLETDRITRELTERFINKKN